MSLNYGTANLLRERPGASGRDGFTLLELLVAAFLIAVVAVVVATAFGAGFKVWQRASHQGLDGEALVTLEQMVRDVRNTVPSRLAMFRGGADWLEIPSSIMASGSSNALPGVIRYEFKESAGILTRLVRRFRPPEGDLESRGIVLERVERLRFSYAERGVDGSGISGWGDLWNGSTNLPVAVKVECQLRQGDERFEIVRTIPIPGG